jgi:hypothetical protein
VTGMGLNRVTGQVLDERLDALEYLVEQMLDAIEPGVRFVCARPPAFPGSIGWIELSKAITYRSTDPTGREMVTTTFAHGTGDTLAHALANLRANAAALTPAEPARIEAGE